MAAVWRDDPFLRSLQLPQEREAGMTAAWSDAPFPKRGVQSQRHRAATIVFPSPTVRARAAAWQVPPPPGAAA
jgi:hypothetical protein